MPFTSASTRTASGDPASSDCGTTDLDHLPAALVA